MTGLTVEQTLTLALQHHQAGRVRDAEYLYRRILSNCPNQPDALHLLGVLAHGAAQDTSARSLILRAINARPDVAIYYNNLGLVLASKQQWFESLAAFKRAISLDTAFPQAWNNAANILDELGRMEEAVKAYWRAVSLRPNYPEAWSNLGNTLQRMYRPQDAIEACRKALALRPDYPEALSHLSAALKDVGHIDEAVAALRRTIELTPAAAPHSSLLYMLQFLPNYPVDAELAEHRRFNEIHARPLASQSLRHANDRSPNRRLRIGYLSPDFRNHCQSLFTFPLLRHHDHENFEIHCYADVAHPDAVTARLRSCADAWHDISGMTDEQLAAQVRADRIDILVDLTLHMTGNRLLVFARKPAPVQLTWLGYPGTTGIDAMGYRLSDPHLDPPGSDGKYSERTVRLADSFWCYDSMTRELPVNELPALNVGFVTFGCLNNFCKVNDTLLELWGKVLLAVPNSRFLLLTPPGEHRQKIVRKLSAMGVTPDRLEFIAYQPRRQYLETYRRIDIVLDTFPVNGHTTALDGLWMGVPMVSLCGKPALSRAGHCYMTNLGLMEWVAHTPEQYARIAAKYAADLPALASLRRSLRTAMENSPLMDAPRFAKNMEQVYRNLWCRWCDQDATS